MAKRERIRKKKEEKDFRRNESAADEKSRDRRLCSIRGWQSLYCQYRGLR
jgi:hypothetical protein